MDNYRLNVPLLFGLSSVAVLEFFRRDKRAPVKKTQKNFVHRGTSCNICEVSPIIGARYRCINCISFDICSKCEEKISEIHDNKHLFLKIKVPIPAQAIPPGPMSAVLYPGSSEASTKTFLNDNEIIGLCKNTNFNEDEIKLLFEQFKLLQKNDGIDKEIYLKCLGHLAVQKNLIIDRIFDFFDQGQDGVIDFFEFVCGLSVLCKGSIKEKTKYAFRGYDLDLSLIHI
eukprot:TRINITY_DN4594_c0_g1_i4.p1 TRINITY_DN4594_c0_g1~~TRINITY_DN4594_c0_g1_i4.p1  ORF type:complete len:228 (-),score=30.16 TRINITY_DN4594_c0_g1_i4:36-719(-)